MKKIIISCSCFVLLFVCFSVAMNTEAWWGGEIIYDKNTHNIMDLQIGRVYNSYTGYSGLEYYDDGGSLHKTYEASNKYSTKNVITYYHICWQDREDILDYGYSIQYAGIANAPYYSEPIGAKDPTLAPNGTIALTFSQKPTVTTTYEYAASNTIKNSNEISAKYSISSKSKNGSISMSGSSSYSEVISKSYKETSVQGNYSWNDTFYITQPGYYFMQRRALYDVYFVLTFYSEYTIKNVSHYCNWFWSDREVLYSRTGYDYCGVTMMLVFKTDLGPALTRYVDDGNANLTYVPEHDGNYRSNYVYMS